MLACAGAAFAGKPERLANVEGTWLLGNQADQPCAIFQQGQILLLVNERGSLATAIATGPKTFVVKSSSDWDIGLIGTISRNNSTIQWSNGTSWSRN